MTIFMSFQWLTGKIKAGSARLASAVSPRTWVVRGPLSNRQMLKGGRQVAKSYPKSCEIRPIVALSKGVSSDNAAVGCNLLSKTGGRRTRVSAGRDRRSRTAEPNGDGGPDGAAAFIPHPVPHPPRSARPPSPHPPHLHS